ncbi:MAG TPA: transketolase [Elusimicrobia bacterium]|nr:transketolase [Elusimicrobiota bacterium]
MGSLNIYFSVNEPKCGPFIQPETLMDKSRFLRKKADEIRDRVIEVSIRNKAGHIAPSLSTVDMLVALYYDVMRYRPKDPLWDGRDRLVFSKGHGCYALYAILADKGILPAKEWAGFYTPSSSLSGCLEKKPEYGLEAGCGSLGHGLPMAVGMAFGARFLGKKFHTFCVAGDGEMQEGSMWEALQYAVRHGVDNLTLIVDANRLQAMDFLTDVLDRNTSDLLKRLRGFGLKPVVCPGHYAPGLARVLARARNSRGKVPHVVVARTVKGRGLKCMENVPKFHFRIPEEKELLMGKTYGRN